VLEDAVYRVRTTDDKVKVPSSAVSGAYIMHHGLELGLSGDYDSTLVVLEQLPQSDARK
jgi:hypothetical protein